jgi:hypothetical protein
VADQNHEPLHGIYGEKLTLVDPPSLQEILSGVFAGIEDFDVVTGGAVRANGVEYSHLRARACPKTTADAKVRCTVR